MTLRPELRMDKNGNMVTRHIKQDKMNSSKRDAASLAPTLAVFGDVTCTECTTTFQRGTLHECFVGNLVPLTPTTEKVLQAIRDGGGRPILVGGSVRDALLSKGDKSFKPKDIDIEVHDLENVEAMLTSLKKQGRVDLTGVSFGVYKITIGKEDFDVSLPRRESKSGSGHRGFVIEVDPTIDEVEAFGRRDFTINAMGFDPESRMLVDPYGGTQDLRDGIIRHPTNAFADDPLRVVRAVRFASRFGFDVAPETIEECRRIKDSFSELPSERIWGEFEKILTSGMYISKALEVLNKTGWEEHFPEIAALHDVPQDPIWHPEGNVHTHVGLAADRAAQMAVEENWDVKDRKIVVLAALTHDFGKVGKGTQIHTHEDGTLDRISSLGHADYAEEPIKAFAKKAGIPRDLVYPVQNLVRNHMAHAAFSEGEPSAKAVRNLVRRLGEGADGASLLNWTRLVDADQNGRGKPITIAPGQAWWDKASQMNTTAPRKALLDGRVLQGLGIKPSPAFSIIIKEGVQAQDDGLFDDVDGAVEWFKAQRHLDEYR